MQEFSMHERNGDATYYGRRSKKGGYDWVVRIDRDGCFVTDPINDWDKDDDYRDEAQSNPALYDKLDTKTTREVLFAWGRNLF